MHEQFKKLVLSIPKSLNNEITKLYLISEKNLDLKSHLEELGQGTNGASPVKFLIILNPSKRFVMSALDKN